MEKSRDLVENYRSISLLSIPTKSQEKIVHSAIYSHCHIFSCGPFPDRLATRFRYKSRSCATQLVLTHHQWTKALEDGLQVHVVFLDFAKAFDKVLHIKYFCRSFAISECLLKW